jgi:hypothetical protein
MQDGAVTFLRRNAFLVAAALLPLAVVSVFLLASAIPAWTVPPPAYDVLLRAAGPFDQTNPRITIEFEVRDGRVEATVRPLEGTGWAQSVALLRYDHQDNVVRAVPLELPEAPAEGDGPRTVIVEALAGETVVAQARAPDGYEVQSRDRGGPGLVGELFGMSASRRRLALVNGGRVFPLDLPAPYQGAYYPHPQAVGWIVDD